MLIIIRKEVMEMTDREVKLNDIKQILISNIKKKVDDIDDKTEDKDRKIADPLKNAKAIIKHYGTHNRLK